MVEMASDETVCHVTDSRKLYQDCPVGTDDVLSESPRKARSPVIEERVTEKVS